MISIRHRIPAITSAFTGFLMLLTACGPAKTTIPTNNPTNTETLSPISTQATESTQTPYVITATSPAPTAPAPVGTIFLSLADGGYFHLFAYSPQTLPYTRLTAGAWDDITPALSPDGHRLAYSSHRNGYWDLYSMDLGNGNVTRLTELA